MNRNTDPLLSDIVLEDAPQALLLEATLRHARRRRRFRKARNASAAAAAVLAVALIALRPGSPSLPQPATPEAGTPPSRPYQLIATRPLDAKDVASPLPPVAVIATQYDHSIRLLNDDELLAALPAPAGLRRTSPDSQEIIFPTP